MFKIPSFKKLQEQIGSAGDTDVHRSLRAAHLSTSDLAALLSPAADNRLEAMASRSADITAMRFGKTTHLPYLVPALESALYLKNQALGLLSSYQGLFESLPPCRRRRPGSAFNLSIVSPAGTS